MRQDLIGEIAKLRDVTNVIVLTHNIDFVFLQTVFMTAVRQCGNPNLTVLADHQCAIQTYAYQSELLSGLGTRFRVVPVAMETGFRFHPKAILLSGPEEATLFVGSGNLTFGGLRENAEVWARFRTSAGEGTAFSAFRDYLKRVLDRVALPDTILDEIEDAFDARNHSWTEALGAPGLILGRITDGIPLIDRMLAELDDEPVTGLTVCTPYFDPEATALAELSRRLGNPPTRVLVQGRRSNLFKEAAENLPQHVKLVSIRFRHEESSEESGNRFAHAKIYGVEQGERVMVFAGSANCSRAALLSAGGAGNAELLAVHSLARRDFSSLFVDQFTFLEAQPELLSRDDVDDEDVDVPQSLALVAARYETGELLLGYRMGHGLIVSRCEVDGKPFEFSEWRPGEISVKVFERPREVQLFARSGNVTVASNELWIDDEQALRSTSRGRGVLDAAGRAGSSGLWQAEEWTLVLERFAQDLEYIPARDLRRSTVKAKEKPPERTYRFKREDVFSEKYDRTPRVPESILKELGNPSLSIQRLLLHVFGVEHHADDDAVSPTSEDLEDTNGGGDAQNDDPNQSDDQPVDRPDEPPLRQSTRKTVAPLNGDEECNELTEKDRYRVTQLVEAITKAIVAPEYLELRDAHRLGIDLQIAALVLRLGYSKGWIEPRLFFETSQHIWATLFFTSPVEKGVGWLEYRHHNSDDPERFVKEVSSDGLSAALFTWATAVPITQPGPYTQRFLLAQLLGAGRVPWFWRGADESEDDIYVQILRIVRTCPCGVATDLNDDRLHRERIALLRKGAALFAFESALERLDMQTIRSLVNDARICTGDLLWQGSRGFCIALESANEHTPHVRVVCLQDPEGEAKFCKDYLVSAQALLDRRVVPDTTEFSDRERSMVGDLFREVQALGRVAYIRNREDID